MTTKFIPLALLISLVFSSAVFAESLEDLPPYQPATFSKGVLTSIGSDSMDNLLTVWVERYKKLQPKVILETESKGSATAPAALLEGTANLGHMIRPMKTIERNAFLAKFGFEPTQIKTAFSSLSIYVAKDNPLNEISIDELDAIFSSERQRGGQEIKTWAEVGVGGALSSKTIMPFGKIDATAAHAFFKQKVLLQAAFKKNVLDVSSASSLFEAIMANPNAIGYAETKDVPEGVKVVAVSHTKTEQAIKPEMNAIVEEAYPLARALNLYVVKSPGEELDPVLKDFLSYVLSAQGQKDVVRSGFLPLPKDVLVAERQKLN